MLSTVSVQKLVRYGQLALLGTSNAATTTSAGSSDAAAATSTLNCTSFVKRSYTDTAKKVADGPDVSVNVAVLTSTELWSSALDSLITITSTHARTVPDGLIAASVFTTAMCAYERSHANITPARRKELDVLLTCVTSVVALLNRSNTSESLLLAQCFATLVNIAAEMCLLDMDTAKKTKSESSDDTIESVPARLLVTAANQFQRLSGSFLLPKVFAPKLAGQQLRGLLRQKAEAAGVGSPYQHWSLMQRLAVLVESDAIPASTKVSIHDLVAPYLGTRTSRYFVYLRGGEAGSGGGATGAGRSGRSNASNGGNGANGPLIGGGLGGGDERMVLAGCKDIAVQSSPLAFVCTPPVDPDVLGELLFLSKVVASAGATSTGSVSITPDRLTADAIRRSFGSNSSAAVKTAEVTSLMCSWAASVGLVFDGFCDSPSWSLFAVEQRRKVVAKRIKDQERQSKKALKEQEREVQRKIKARAIEALVQARAEEAKANLELRATALKKNGNDDSDDDKMSQANSNAGSNASSAVSAAPSWAFSAGGMSRAESDVRSMMSAASFASYSTFLSVVDSEALDREHREQHESADGNSNLPLILMEMGSFALYQCIEAVREEKLLVPYFQQIFRKDAAAMAALATYSTQLEGLYTALWRAVTDLFASAARRMRVGVTSGSSGAQVPFFSLADDVQYNCGLGYQSLGLIFARLIVPSLLSEATEDRLTAPPPFMGTVAARARRARIALSELVTEAPELATQFRRDLQRTEASHMAHALAVYETVAPQVINQNIGAVFTVCCRIAEDSSCEASTRDGFSHLMRCIVNRLGQANQLQLLVKAVVDGVAKKKASKDAESDEEDEEEAAAAAGGVVELNDKKLNATLNSLTTLQQTAISTSDDAQTLLSSAAFRQAFSSAVSDTLDTEALLSSVATELQKAVTSSDADTCITSLVVTLHMISITLQGLNPSTFASFPVFEKLIELEVALGHELLASMVAPALFGTLSAEGGNDEDVTKNIILGTPKKMLRSVFILGCEVLVRIRSSMLNCMSDLAVESLKDVLSMINETVWRIGAGDAPTLVGTAPQDDEEATVATLTTENIVGCVAKSTTTPLTGIHFSHVLAKLAAQRLLMFDQIAVLEGTPTAPEQHRTQYATFVEEQNALRVTDVNLKHPSELYTLALSADEYFHLSHGNTIAQTASPAPHVAPATSLQAATKATITDPIHGAISFINFLEGSTTVDTMKALQAPETSSIPTAKLASVLAKALTSTSNNSVSAAHLLTRLYDACASVPVQPVSTRTHADAEGEDTKKKGGCIAHGLIRDVIELMLEGNDDAVRSGLFKTLFLGTTDPRDPKPVSYILPRHTHRFASHPLLATITKVFKQLMRYSLSAVFTGERAPSQQHAVFARTFAVLATQYIPIIFEKETVANMVTKAVKKSAPSTATTNTIASYEKQSVAELVGDISIYVALDTIASSVAAASKKNDAEKGSGQDSESEEEEVVVSKKKRGGAIAVVDSPYIAPIKVLVSALQTRSLGSRSVAADEEFIFEASPQLLAGHVKHSGPVYTAMYALVANTMNDAISRNRLTHAMRTLLHLRTVPTVAFSNLYPCILAALSHLTRELTSSTTNPAQVLATIRAHRDAALELSCFPLASFFTGAMGGALFTAVTGTMDAMIQAAADLLAGDSLSIAEHVVTIQRIITATSHMVAHHPNVVFGTRAAALPGLMRSIFQGVMRGLEAESNSTSSSAVAKGSSAASALVPFNTLLARCTGTISGSSSGSGTTTNFDDAVATSVFTCNAGTGPRAMVCAAIASALLSSVNKAAQLVMFSSHSEQFDMLGKELLVAMGRARLPRASVARCMYVASQQPQAPSIGFKRPRDTKGSKKDGEEGEDNAEEEAAPLPLHTGPKSKLPIIKTRRRLEASKIAANSLSARTTYVSLCYASIGNTDGQQLLHQLSLRVNDETGRSIFQVSQK